MKTTYTRLLLTTLLLVASVTTWAYDVEVDGIYYDCDEINKTVEVTYNSATDYNRYSGDVNIPETITYDGESYRVTSIGNAAFKSCKNLVSVTISNSVTSIGSEAFYQCSKLTSLTIPSSVTMIGSAAFSSTPWWNSYSADANNIYDHVIYINDLAYKVNSSSITECTIREGTISICNGAFHVMNATSSLKSITIPYGVQKIGVNAFYACKDLTSITIPGSVKEIDYQAFGSCTSLTSVNIEEGVTSIGSNAFSDCTSLRTIAFPNSLTSFGSNLEDTPWYNSYIKNTDNVYGNIIYLNDHIAFKAKSTDITECNFKESTTCVCSKAFYGCTGLTSINIPNSVTSIYGSAFYGCTGLTTINIPNGVTTICGSTFYDCTGLTLLTIPESVTYIEGSAFHGCTGLTSLTIPETVTTFENLAFSGCSGLTSLTIPKHVKKIGYGAFNSSSIKELIYNAKNAKVQTIIILPYYSSFPSSITKLTIGDCVKILPEKFVYNCSNLTSVTIPSSVIEIGPSAFIGCSSLTSVYNYATTPQTLSSSNDFSNAANCTLYVPKGSVDTYKAASYWKNFKEILAIEDEPTAITNLNSDNTKPSYMYYNLTGRKFSTPQKGLNIVNGKKVIY